MGNGSRARVAFAGLALFIIAAVGFAASHGRRGTDRGEKAHAARNSGALAVVAPQTARLGPQALYDRVPFSFEQNVGQSSSKVRYLARGGGYQLFLTNDEAVLSLARSTAQGKRASSGQTDPSNTTKRSGEFSILRMRLVGASRNPSIAGVDPLPGRTSYFVGNDPAKWHSGIRSYSKVEYRGVYPGVDMLFYGQQRRLEYDFIVSPGADPRSISLRLAGAKSVRVDESGNLQVGIPGGRVDIEKPLIYQERNGTRQQIAGGYVITGERDVKFQVGAYDSSKRLVLDPVVNYGSYLGGAGDDEGHAIAVDASGNAYITGCTASQIFPDYSPSAPQNSIPSGNKAAFVVELSPSGTTLVPPISTYILGGGSAPGDCGNGIAVDTKGNIYVTGQTFSSNFPIAGSAVQTTAPSGTGTNGTGFVSIISPTATPLLIYSSYLGIANALNGDAGLAIALDATPNAYVVGRTLSTTGLATGNAAQSTNNAPALTTAGSCGSGIGGNAFLAKINPTPPQGSSSTLLYYSYLGGSTGSCATGVAADSTGKAYITGKTYDSTAGTKPFPTTAASYTPNLATNSNGVGFFSVVDTTQSGANSLVYSTYFGSASGTGGGDTPSAIALSQNKIAYITGDTASSDFATTSGAFQSRPPVGAHNAFLTLFNATQAGTASFVYSTLFGGTGTDIGKGVAVDSTGNAYLIGYTNSSAAVSPAFPTTSGALQTTLPNATDSGFVAKLSPQGNGAADLLYSTYLGGSGTAGDFAYADAVGNASSTCSTCVYVTGATSSSNFVAITTGSLQTSYVGVSPAFDAFATMLPLVSAIGAQPQSLNFQTQLVPAPITYPSQSVTITNNTSSNISLTSYAVGTPYYIAVPASTNGCSQTQNLPAGSSCVISVSFNPGVSQATTPATSVPDTLIINDSLASSPQQKIMLAGLATNSAGVSNITPTAITYGQVFLNSATSAQTVTVANAGNANLTVNSISISPATTVFAQTNTCSPPVTLTPGQNCAVSVTFDPTTAAASTATLSITASDSTTPHTIPLSGSGVGFTITAPSALTVNSGSTATMMVTMTPLGGFTGSVSLACTGNPVNSTCSISPISVAASDGRTAQSATVTVGTSSAIVGPAGREWPWPLQRIVLWILAIATLTAFARARRLRSRILLGTATLALALIAGCGASQTTAGNYTLTLTGTSGAETQTATFTLTVAQ